MKLHLCVLLCLALSSGLVSAGVDVESASTSLRYRGRGVEYDGSVPSAEGAVLGLIDRVLGRSEDFVVSIVEANDGTDNFDLYAKDGKIHIDATTGVAAASGFKRYLDTVLRAQITWSGDNIPKVTGPLPLPSVGSSAKSPFKYRYYQNVCTVSYSMAFWDWARWEREIDWMAMNGINMPLAFTGQEYVWVKLYEALGLSEEEINDMITGPAFYAWNRMGNMQSWGSLSEARKFNEAQRDLQIKILARMRSLNIIPVLPAFAGHVPRALSERYPNANITMSPNWGNFPPCCGGVRLLEPTDELFQTIGKKFIEIHTEVYGTDHIYNADTFNEMAPASSEPAYLKAAGSAVYNSMKSADPKAIWLMQGWLFVNDPNFWKEEQMRALLDSVPDANMIILDLTSDVIPVWQRTQSYYGKPFIWNMLHNYGGNVGFYGKIPTLNAEVPASLTAPNSTVVGIGLTPEGINQNYMVYEFMMDNTWRSQPVDTEKWTAAYVERRYGSATPPSGALMAYHKLLNSVWSNNNTQMGVTKGLYEVRPALQYNSGQFMPTKLFYNPMDVVDAWDAIMDKTTLEALQHLDTYRFDITDITRQVLSDYFIKLHAALADAYNKKNSKAVAAAGSAIIEMLTDLDSLLATNEHFLLGAWIRDARQWAQYMQDKDTAAAEMEFNARNQVTMWGPTGEISDYASKQWAGLISLYYVPRWTIFIQDVQFAVDSGVDFDANWYTKHVFAFELHWNNGPPVDTPSEVTGNTIEVATQLYAKYHARVHSAYGNHSAFI